MTIVLMGFNENNYVNKMEYNYAKLILPHMTAVDMCVYILYINTHICMYQ